MHFLRLGIDLDEPAVHLAGDDVARGVDHQAVGVVRRIEDRAQLALGIDLVKLVALHVAEIEIAFAIGGGPFGELKAAVDFFAPPRSGRCRQSDRRRKPGVRSKCNAQT